MATSGDVALGNYRHQLKCVMNFYRNGTYYYTTWKDEEILSRMTVHLFTLFCS